MEAFNAVIKANPHLSDTVQQTEDGDGHATQRAVSPGYWRSAFDGTITCLSKAY
jgi:hypothetical protein